MEEEKVEAMTECIFLGSKIMVIVTMKLKDDCSLEGKLWHRQLIKKKRHHFADKGPYRQNCDFPVVMCEYESWTIKKTQCWRIDAFELWCWRRLLRVHWTAGRSNQSILKDININIHWKDWCWSTNALATWCKGANSLGKTLVLGKIEGTRSEWLRMR